VLALLIAGLAACATAPAPQDQGAQPPPPTQPQPAAQKLTKGALERAAFRTFLARGPGYLFQLVSVEPVLDERGLSGYRVLAIDRNFSALDDVDLEPGDIVMAVNGQAFSDPEAFFALWQGLAEAAHLQVDIRRGQQLFSLTWELVDAAAAEVGE
jgi:type II secretory pathway component PulC